MCGTLKVDVLKKYSNPTFFETGTFRGSGVVAAKEAGFKKIITLDINPEWTDLARAAHPDVEVHCGDSRNIFRPILCRVPPPITFWIDAHSNASEKTLPAAEELLAIHSIWNSRNVILIDDITTIGNGGWGWNGRTALMQVIVLFVMIGCQITYEDNKVKKRDIMVIKMP